MANFSHLKKYDIVEGKVVDYNVVADHVLKVRIAGESNKPYLSELLRRNAKYARQINAGKVSAAMLAETRNDDRELFAKYVVAGWENVTDADGNPVTFTIDECWAFLRELPDHMFDDLRAFASNAMNFVDTTSSAGSNIAKN